MTDIVGKTGLSGAFDTGLHRSRTIAVAHCHLLRNETGQPIDYVVREVNDAYEQITGIHRSSVEGRLVTEVFPGIERVHFDFVGKLVAIGLHGGEMDCELYNPLTHQWLSMYAYASGPDECTAIFVDVSAQKRAEATLRRHQAQLQAIIDNSPVLISMKDRQGKVILANKALLDLVGATQPDQVVGHHVFELFPAEVAAQLWRNDLAALQGNGPVRAEEEVQDKDGDWRTFLTVKFPVSDSATQ